MLKQGASYEKRIIQISEEKDNCSGASCMNETDTKRIKIRVFLADYPCCLQDFVTYNKYGNLI